MANRILFTCAGATDPVRGNRDGGILHIMRYYRPEKIYLFLSAAMVRCEKQDQRFTKMVQYPRKAAKAAKKKGGSPGQWDWAKYHPTLITHNSTIENPSDMDKLYGPIISFFEMAAAENPDSQILINLSSGTPQMQVVLARLATDLKYNVVGIQIANPVHESGRQYVQNDHIDEELEVNQDEKLKEDGKPVTPNRCVESKMLSLLHENERQHNIELIKCREYHALYKMYEKALSTALPTRVWPMIQHLEARSSMQNSEAVKLAEKCSEANITLYPMKGNVPDAEYRAVSEYYLILRNLQLTEHYTEFVLRLNPFLMKLSLRFINCWLPCQFDDIVDNMNNRQYLNRDKMKKKVPDILSALEKETQRWTDSTYPLSLITCVSLMIVLNAWQPAEERIADNDIKLLKACIQLNQDQRNLTAHELHAVTETDFKKTCTYDGTSYNAKDLIDAFGRMLELAWECCDPELFTVYDRCNEYLMRNI